MAVISEESYIGQQYALKTLHTWKKFDAFPHFLIVVGQLGSGRKTFANLFALAAGARISILEEVNANSIRQLIDTVYSIQSKMVYVIPEADNMSAAAANSLLKLTEEPPENAYIIMTLMSLDNILSTLVNRSHQILLNDYSEKDLEKLASDPLFAKVANTPGMLQTLEEFGKEYTMQLIDFCTKFVDHISTVTVVNALASADKLKFKESDKGYSVELMLAGIQYVLGQKLLRNYSANIISTMHSWYVVLSKYRPMFARSGVNKRAVYDQLVFEIRQELKKVRKISGTLPTPPAVSN